MSNSHSSLWVKKWDEKKRWFCTEKPAIFWPLAAWEKRTQKVQFPVQKKSKNKMLKKFVNKNTPEKQVEKSEGNNRKKQ